MSRPRVLFVTESSGLRPGIIAKGLLEECHRLNMELRWREYDSLWAEDGELAETFDALVFWGKRTKLQEVLNAALPSLPIVSVISSTADLPVPTIIPDPLQISTQIADHLLAQGLKHFFFVGASENPAAVSRAELFHKTLVNRGKGVHYTFFDCPWDELFWGADSQSGRRFIRMLQDSPRPFGTFAVNDQTAVSCIECIREAGLSIPREAAVVGVDNHPLYTTMLVPLTSVSIDFVQIGRTAIRALEEQFHRTERSRRRRRKHYFVDAELIVRDSSQVGLQRDQKILEAIRYLESNCQHPLSLPDLACRFGMSRSGFVNRFHKATGSPPIDFLINVRMRKAKILLTESRMTIREIASRVGFEDQAYFCRAFKRRFKTTPTSFRKSS